MRADVEPQALGSPQRLVGMAAVSRIAAGIALAIALAVFVGGWILGLDALKSIPSGAVTMKANTALGLLLAASALLLDSRASRARHLAAMAAAAVTVAIGGLTLAEHLSGAELAIDRFLFAGQGRLSVNTAGSLAALGVALLMRGRNRNPAVTHTLALVAASLCTPNLIGALYGAEGFGTLMHTATAIHTVIAVILLSIAILLATPEGGLMRMPVSDSPGGHLLRRLLPAAVLIPLLFGWLRWRGEIAGYYGTAYGMALNTTLNIAVLVLLIWLTAGRIDRADRERTRAVDALHESQQRLAEAHAEERFRLSFEHAPVGMLLLDSEGRWLRANRAMCQLTGYDEAELIAINHGINHPDYLKETQERVRALIAGEVSSYLQEKRYVHKDGQTVDVLVSVSALTPDEHGRARGFVAHIVDITERRRAERAFAESEARFRDLVESAPDAMVIIDRAGKIVYVNSQAERLFGYERGEFLGAPLEMLVPAALRGEHVERRDEYFRRPQARQMRAPLELTGMRKDGRELPLEVSLSPIAVDGGVWVSSTIRDVSERRQRDKELRNQAKLLSLAHDAIIVRDLEGRVLFWNRGAEAKYLWTSAEAQRQNLRTMLQTVWPTPIEEIERVLYERGVWEGELRQKRRDGREIVVESRQSLHVEDGVPISIMEINRDITDRKRFEAELEANRAQAAATARLSALGEMSAGIAHEVNNPLTVISASARNLVRMAERDEISKEGLLKQAGRITQTADRIAKIVKSLRHIARDDSRDDFREVAVAEIVEECLELCGERFRVHSVRLESPRVDPAIHIRCREAQIGQVLLNLLQNAFDAVSDAGGEMRAGVEVSVRGDRVILVVSDSGPGIPPEAREHIMEPFYTTKLAGKGTGLGLSISRGIALEHAGTLSLSDAPGPTRFELDLPLAGGGAAQ